MKFEWNGYELKKINDMDLDQVMSKSDVDWVKHECELLEIAAEKSSIRYIKMIKSKIEANAEIHVHNWLL